MQKITKPTILIVDDDPTNAEILSEYLKKSELETMLSQTGVQAIAQCETCTPDLVLLDVMMPDMDGPTTLAELYKQPELAHIPAIFMTAKVQPQEVAQLRTLGAVDVITKPFDPMTLSDQIRKIWEEIA